MLPRTVFLIFCLSFSVAFLPSARSKNALATPPALQPSAAITKGYCASDPSGPTVYFSKIFDVNIKALTKISTAPLNNAFRNYLVEEYDFNSRSSLPTGCSVFETLSQAEGRRSQLISEAQRANKQIVEVNWNPNPLEEVPMGDAVAIGPKGSPATHTICALGHQDTMYFSAVFDTSAWQVNPAWNDSFNDFLRKTYSAEGEAGCTTMNTVREAERLLRDRVAGVRAQRRKAVETGWRYNASVVVTKQPPKPKVDDDAEPVAPSRPPVKAAPADIRQFATAEVPAALAYCQNDRMISGAFDCYCIQRAVYNYRLEHAGEPNQPEPLNDLFAKDKLNCSNCVAQFVSMWARSRAQSGPWSLPLPAAECVAKRFETSLRAKPYPAHVKELFSAAIAACK